MKSYPLVITTIMVGFLIGGCSLQTASKSGAVISTGPSVTAETYLERGDQFAQDKNYGQAISEYSQAIQLKPDFAEAYNNRGLAFAISGKQAMVNAIEDYSQAIQLRPAYATAYNNRGVAYMASGHPNEALSDFNHTIQLQPVFSQAYSNLGNAYNRQGKVGLAVPYFVLAGLSQPFFVLEFCAIPLAVVIIITWLIVLLVRRHQHKKTEPLSSNG